MRNQPSNLEALESRTLMSAGTLVFSEAVQLDRLQIQVDLLKVKTDVLTSTITLLTDDAAMKADHIGQAKSITPLIKQLRTDVQSFRLTLLEDRLTEAQNVLTDETAIVGVLEKIVADKGNAGAEATEHAALTADRIKLQNDMIAGLDQRIADREAGVTKLFADGQAIEAALPSAAGVSTKLAADITQWLSDADARLNTVTVDLQKLVADRTKLVAALSSE